MNRRRDALSGQLVARLIGAVLIFGSLALAVMSFVPPQLPWNRSFHVTVASAAFGEMNPNAGVELAGVRVGSVERIEYKSHDALLHLAISPAYADRIHSDATATIQPHGLLGPKYVALTAGAVGHLADGATIPRSRTTVTTDFDQVLNSFQPDVRQNLKVIFVELGTAADSRGVDMNQALGSLSASADNMRTATGLLRNRESDTTLFVRSSEVFNRDVQNAPIAENIADTNRVLAALAAVENDLGDSIDHTAGVLQSVDVIMSGNADNLAYVLGHAPRTVTNLNRYIDTNTQLINGIRPSLPNLLTASVFGESVVGGQDANGHYVRVLALSGPCTAGPSTECSTPNPPHSGASGSLPPTTVPASFAGMSDEQLSALFLGT